MRITYFILTSLMLMLLLSGCASMMTDTSQFKGTANLLKTRDVGAVITRIESSKGKNYKNKDMVLYYLDMGLLYHYAGRWQESNTMLEQAENLMEELYTKSISKAALSLLLNDNALDYFGEDYENVYTNAFKAMNYLHLKQFDDAFVEIRRINTKLDLLEDKYQKLASGYNTSTDTKVQIKPGSNHFYNSALGRYLSMTIYEAEGLRDDARLDYTKLKDAFALQPDIYAYSLPTNLYDPLDLTPPTLHVVSLIGTSPVKRARDYNIATNYDEVTVVAVDKTVDAVTIYWPGIKPNYYFKFSLPYMVQGKTDIHTIKVVIDGNSYTIGKLEDIGTVAEQTFKIKEPVIFLKSVTRSVVKGLVAEDAKTKMQQQNPGIAGGLMSLATDVAVYASENADLRLSRFFPNDVYIADIPVTAGEHNIAVEYYDRNNTLRYKDQRNNVTISPTGINLIESWELE